MNFAGGCVKIGLLAHPLFLRSQFQSGCTEMGDTLLFEANVTDSIAS